MDETGDKGSDKNSNLEKTHSESDESLSLSITPPIPNKPNEDKSESISEHIISNSGSIENDRSFQEIEISHRPEDDNFNSESSDEVQHCIGVTQEGPSTLEPNFDSDYDLNLDEIITAQDRPTDVSDNVRSILEEILGNEQFLSHKEISLDESKEESLNIFANIKLDDQSLSKCRHNNDAINETNLFASNFGLPSIRNECEAEKRIKHFQELVAIKDSTIAVLTSELDSFREMSNTNTVSTLSTTEYKQLQEDCHNKLLECSNVIMFKNDLIQQLTESLDKSVTERKDLLNQIDCFKDEIAQLQEQLQHTTQMVEEHTCLDLRTAGDTDLISTNDISQEKTECSSLNLDKEYSILEHALNIQQKELLEDLKSKISKFIDHNISRNKDAYEKEINKLKDQNVVEKEDYEVEIARLTDLLTNIKYGSSEMVELKTELEAKHSREVEELRTYFEQKCADLEKNFSEEVFSQQSRKMSDSTSSDVELNSDMHFSHPPGPDGDIPSYLPSDFTKKDIINLQNELSSLISKIEKYNVDNMDDEDFNNLKSEIGTSNLSNLFKYEISVIRRDLQNKHQAELEVLKKEHRNKLDELGDQYENQLTALENKYQDEICQLKMRLDGIEKDNCISSAVQEVASSGEFEISEVIQSYERRLQEQVTLAKIDIISALESQIQRLVANEADDEEWPSELLQLRDRFTDKYENEIQMLKKEHQDEIEKLKEEHLKMLNGALDRARRRSLKDNDSLSKGELEILRERDNLKKQVSSLRNLLGELLKYFTQCEDEVNNTLVEELLKHGFDKNLSQVEEDLNLTNSSSTNSNKTNDSFANITRVHLTPNFSDLINLIENSFQDDSESKDVSVDLKNELGSCLGKLKQEANAILALTSNFPKLALPNPNNSSKNPGLEEKITSLTRQLIGEAQAKENLKDELNETRLYVESLEKEKENLENLLDQMIAKENVLATDLTQAKNKIAELIENGHKEIISEGYGEEGSGLQGLGDNMIILMELQEKARNMLAQSRATADPTLLHLIEELCRIGERIKEESKREKQDLLQQIDVADKKYRATQKFLEEQAIEREQERDEAQKKIDVLHEQLKERDRDKVSCERAMSEVEHLELQLQEMTRASTEESEKLRDLEIERNEAVEKIKVLRDIIRELEVLTETKSSEIEQCVLTIKKLQCIIDQQDRSIIDISKINSSKDISDVSELYRHIEYLEAELQVLRVNSELAGSEGALKQIRIQLCEIELHLDRKTKELEVLHSADGTNCSSPSEDISARDIVLPTSPSKMDECEVPLQQLARLKEKLVRHSRAEDAAMKRIKDLEMQVFGLKRDLVEANAEKEFLKKQAQEQLVLISNFQIRLDEQRLIAEHNEKHTNKPLELKVFDLQNEITLLRQQLETKDRSINQQKLILSETQEQLRILNKEIETCKDDEIVVCMQQELEALRAENAQIKVKIEKDAEIVPCLVGNIISDKNMDIEKLRGRLSETEKQLEMYTSLNLDKKQLQTLLNLKNSGTSLEELVDMSVRRLDSRTDYESLDSINTLVHKKKSEDVTMEPEISAILGPNMPIARNSTEISQKKVHFEDTDMNILRNEIVQLKEELKSKQQIIKEYESRVKMLNNLENKIEKLQLSLEETEKALTAATETFEKEQQEMREQIRNLGVDLAEKKMQLSEAEKRIEILELDSTRKDDMYMNLTKEKRNLERALSSIKHESFTSIDNVIKEKNEEIEELKHQLVSGKQSLMQKLENKNMEVISLQTEAENWSYKMEQLKANNRTLEEKLKTSANENAKLSKELQNNMVQIESITSEMNNLREKLNKKRKIIKEYEDTVEKNIKTTSILEEQVKRQKYIIEDRECEIEIANEDAKRYQNDLAALEDEINELKKGNAHELLKEVREKDLKIDELIKDKNHMMELVDEKEKIINQMAEDSHQLHVNLVTIKNKIKEPGNIIDLGNKLREEQRKTAELLQEIHTLKAQLLHYKNSDIDEITSQLKRELDYSAQMDSNIISAISDQSLSSVSETQDVEIYKKALTKEKAFRKHLTLQVNKLQGKIAEQQIALENEHTALLQTQTDDAQLIQQLRIQLDLVLDKEDVLKKELEEKKEAYEALEKRIGAIERKNTNSSASKTDSTEYRSLPTKEMLELNQLRKDYETVRNENNRLQNEIELIKEAKISAESECKHVKDMLNLEIQRAKNMEEKIQSLMESERKLMESLVQNSNKMQNLMDSAEKEKADLIKQKAELLMQFQEQAQHKAATSASDIVFEKIRELNNALLDNKKLMDIIQKLSTDKRLLESELRDIREGNGNVTTNELVARNDYLFAKTLKLESTKKALVWQKRYLAKFLQSHQQHCLLPVPNGHHLRNNVPSDCNSKPRFKSVVFAIIAIIRMKYLVRRWHNGVRIAEKVNSRHYRNLPDRLEAAVSTDFQVGQPVSSQLFSNIPVGLPRNLNAFELIQQQKESAFVNVESERVSPVNTKSSVPWSGNTPPSKDRVGRLRIGSNFLNKDDMTPLKAPQLLAQFAERFDQIQEKLGIIDSSAT